MRRQVHCVYDYGDEREGADLGQQMKNAVVVSMHTNAPEVRRLESRRNRFL